MENFIVYDTTTGEVSFRGQGPDGTAAIQQLQPGLATMVVPPAIWGSSPLDLDGIRALAAQQIDRAAEAFRMVYLTPGAGQALTYQTKAAEAAAYLADNTATVPFLSAEASARGMMLPDLANEVASKAAEWTIIGSRIEARRMAAKAAVTAAANLAQIADAIAIDWSAAISAEGTA